MKKIFIALSVMCLGACQSQFELPKPESFIGTTSEAKIYNKQTPEAEKSDISADGTYEFSIKIGEPMPEDAIINLANSSDLANVVAKYNEFKGVQDYAVLPTENYEFTPADFKKGEVLTDVQLKIKDYQNLSQGDYILPLLVNVGSEKLMHLVFVRKDAHFVPLSPENKKPMPPGNYNCPNRTEPMRMVAYVETNDWDIRNMGQFVLEQSKKPVFDIVILFAANMNYDSKAERRVLFFNDKLQPIVNDPDKYIKPLRDRGIKVLVDILPNHQGVGYFNFQNYEEALDFARQCKEYADKMGIDGYDIDEEYAQYHKLPSKPIRNGEQSMFWFMRAMKEVMPDKLLTLYDYGHGMGGGDRDAETGQSVSDLIDYSWANYGENHGSYAGLPNERYGKLSQEANLSGFRGMEYSARRNIQDCFGNYMIFNIQGGYIRSGSAAQNLSAVTRLYYGENCVFEGKYHPGPKDK